MGYAVLVTLHEEIPEAKVEEILAQIVCIDGVEKVATEWRSDRKRKQEPDLPAPEPVIEEKIEQKMENANANNEEKSSKKNKMQKLAEKEFDQKLAHVFAPPTPKKFYSPMKQENNETLKEGKDRPKVTPFSARLSKSKSPEGNKENVSKSRKSTPQTDESEENRVICGICRTATKWSSLRWHALIHCPRRLYSCKLCSYDTNNVHSVRHHVTVRHAKEPTLDVNYKYNMDEDFKEKWIQTASKSFPDHSLKCESQIRKDLKRC